MGHIDMVRQPYSTHSHMASSQLLDHAPASVNDENTAPTLWNVPLAEVGGPENANAGIQKLLALSGTFQLQGEITPVQAWFKVRNDPRFRLLQETVTGTGPGAATGRMSIGTATALERLERLRQVLWGDVKCYGYGSPFSIRFEISLVLHLFHIPRTFFFYSLWNHLIPQLRRRGVNIAGVPLS